MKTVAYVALHYGRDYLDAAIRSVIDHVDELHVIYTAVGSHGHRTEVPCPETRDELYEIAYTAARHKLMWHEGVWPYEGAQREAILDYAPDADIILVLDADEVWADGLAERAIAFAQTANTRRIRVPMLHLWRSFRRGFAHDPAYPHRVIVPHAPEGDTTLPTYDDSQRIWHFGYAQRSEIVRYKLLTHGHRGEFRRDVDWFNDVFMTNRQHDCHPVGSDAWNCELIDQRALPLPLFDHPYRWLEMIP
jgi:hypothetical protein